MSAGATELRLGVAAKAENLLLVRQALAGLAEAAGMSQRALADLKQIATEACMNSVLHAYPDDEAGRIEVVATAGPVAVELRVRDWGVGFQPRPAEAEGSLRLGLPLIATVAESFEIASPPDGGTAVTARVELEGSDRDGRRPAAPELAAQAEVAVSAGGPARPVISRVLAVAADRAGFNLERLSEGVLIGDAIAAGRAGDFAGGLVRIAVEEWGPDLAVRVGPLADGGGGRLLKRMELPGLGASLSKLANSVEVESGPQGEYLVLALRA